MWFRKVLFTLVFTIFLLIFFGMARAAVGVLAPSWLVPPVDIGSDYFLALLGFFTVLVVVSYMGASSVLYHNLSGDDGTRPPRPARSRSRRGRRFAQDPDQ